MLTIQAQPQFLKLDPLLDPQWWKRCIADQLKKGSEAALAQLRVLIMAVTLRRTKQSTDENGRPILQLPPKEILERNVQLTDSERQSYLAVRREAQRILSLSLQATNEKGMSLVLVALLRLRQLCSHASLAPSALEAVKAFVVEMEKKVEISKEAADRAMTILQGADQCPICLDDFTDERVTPCGHVFCAACIQGVIQAKPVCPMCRAPVTVASLFSSADLAADEAEDDGASKKMEGSMTQKKRQDVISSFNAPDGSLCHVSQPKVCWTRSQPAESEQCVLL